MHAIGGASCDARSPSSPPAFVESFELRPDLAKEQVEVRARLAGAAASGAVVIQLEVDEAVPGGLAVYGEGFGRYPLDPTLVFTLR